MNSPKAFSLSSARRTVLQQHPTSAATVGVELPVHAQPADQGVADQLAGRRQATRPASGFRNT
jgi:hypothetical protein